ncbi:hypothetical protein SEUBUCD646_0B01680 [Saccharomyces eubayanus]|nr:hypothetical protein SEUBUCD646_0B01680 [Saccharomyces eubayanus]
MFNQFNYIITIVSVLINLTYAFKTDTTARSNYTALIECLEQQGHIPRFYLHDSGHMTIIPSNDTVAVNDIYAASQNCIKSSDSMYSVSVCDRVYDGDVVERTGYMRELITDPIEIVTNMMNNSGLTNVSIQLIKRGEGLVTVQHDITARDCANLQPMALLQQGHYLAYRTKPYVCVSLMIRA